jgi:shikimate kinase
MVRFVNEALEHNHDLLTPGKRSSDSEYLIHNIFRNAKGSRLTDIETEYINNLSESQVDDVISTGFDGILNLIEKDIDELHEEREKVYAIYGDDKDVVTRRYVDETDNRISQRILCLKNVYGGYSAERTVLRETTARYMLDMCRRDQVYVIPPN